MTIPNRLDETKSKVDALFGCRDVAEEALRMWRKSDYTDANARDKLKQAIENEDLMLSRLIEFLQLS
jgi:hypothetical protein